MTTAEMFAESRVGNEIGSLSLNSVLEGALLSVVIQKSPFEISLQVYSSGISFHRDQLNQIRHEEVSRDL